MNYKQELSKFGIYLPSYSAGHGNHKVTCPKCSHQRSKKNDPCLSVTIKDDDNSAVWNCHHCSWTGNIFDKDNKNYNREIKKLPYGN